MVADVSTPHFRQLTREEFDRLPLDQRMEYMRQLIEHVRARVKDTHERVEATKRKFPQST